MIEIKPGFVLIHSNLPEMLRELLVKWVGREPLDPLEDEWLMVQSNGFAQWFKLALASLPEGDTEGDPEGNDHRALHQQSNQAFSQGLGIAAALQAQMPARMVWGLYRSVLGREQIPERSLLDRDALLWRLMARLDAWANQPGFEMLKRFLNEDEALYKRFQLASDLADLFDQYQVYRPDWLMAWQQGQDVIIKADGQREALAADQLWQAALWRQLVADLAPSGLLSTAEVQTGFNGSRVWVHDRFMQRLQQAALTRWCRMEVV